MMRRTPARTAIQHALDLLFPPRCAACQKAGHILCPTCFSGIPPLESPLCQHCGKQVGPGSICLDCSLCPVRLSGLRSVSPYQGTLRTCIHGLKYEGNIRLAEPLGLLLAQAFLDYRMQADYMLSVPLHSERQKERGYNHAALLAQVCSKRTGIPLDETLLVRHRSTQSQVGLAVQQRRQNVDGAFMCRSQGATKAVAGRTIVIIDDVCTTGATLEACAAPLFAMGAREVWGLVLARP